MATTPSREQVAREACEATTPASSSATEDLYMQELP